MTPLEETISRLRSMGGLIHLGTFEKSTRRGSAEGLARSWQKEVGRGFDAVNQKMALELSYLRRLQVSGVIAIICGGCVLLASLIMILSGNIGPGILSCVVGAIIEVAPVLIFREIERARVRLAEHLPDYRFLFSAMVIYELGERAVIDLENVAGLVGAAKRCGDPEEAIVG